MRGESSPRELISPGERATRERRSDAQVSRQVFRNTVNIVFITAEVAVKGDDGAYKRLLSTSAGGKYTSWKRRVYSRSRCRRFDSASRWCAVELSN